jgi:hypothetical protein
MGNWTLVFGPIKSTTVGITKGIEFCSWPAKKTLLQNNFLFQVVNSFVKLLVKLMDDAGSYVHCQNIRVKPPKRIPTPYGGRLIW